MRTAVWVGLGAWSSAGCLGQEAEDPGPPGGATLQSGPWKDFDLRPLGALCGLTQAHALDCPLLEVAGVTLPEGTFQSVALTGGSGLAGCGLRSTGDIACFDATAGSRLVSEVPQGRFVALAGHSLVDPHACAVDEAGRVRCWGEGVDDPPPDGTFQAVLSSWDDRFCGLRPDGSLTCWAVSGIGSDEIIDQVPDGSWDGVSVGGGYACAVAGTSVSCWGDVPDDDPPDEALTQVGTGDSNICGVRFDGTAQCWGSGRWGQRDVPGGAFRKVLPAREAVCGLRPDGALVCWGLALF